MKKLLFLSLIAVFAAIPAFAKRDDSITLKVGQTTTVGKIKVRFVAIDSDSRCPAGVTCVWAGNARVKITVSKSRRAAKSFDLNSMLEPRVVTYEGFDIQFVDLTREPSQGNGGEIGILKKGSQKTNSAAAPGTLILSITKHV